jgi:peptidyl-prolyl cis-trans isomerase D
MLKAFQKAHKLKKIVFISMFVLMTLSMVVYLIPGFTGATVDPIFSGVVAEVAGEQIRAFELQQAVLQVSRQNRIPAEMMNLYTSQVLNDLLLEKASLREADQLGLQVSEAELAERLRQIPDLFPQGKFVGRELYEDLVYSRFNVGIPEFETRLRRAILMEKLRNLVTDSVMVYPEEVRKAFQEENEKLVLDYVHVDPAALRQEIKPTDEALQAYYQTNQSRYQIPQKRSARFLWFDQSRLGQAISVTDADLRRYYQQNQDSYRSEERVQVSHILRRTSDPAKKEEARKKAEELLAQLKGVADFATLAKANSEDPGSAVRGGDLGWIVRGQTVPEFEAASFSLEPGKLSDIVETTFGFHILKVAAHDQARLKPFEEVKAEIQTLLQQERLQATLPRQAEEAVSALRRTPTDVEGVAQRLNAQAFTSGPLALDEPLPGIGQAPEVAQEVFSLEKGDVGRAIPIPTGYVIPILLDVFPTHQGTFEEVKERVRTEYVDEQARALASTRANDLAKALEQQDKKDLKRAAQSLRLTVKTSEPLTRVTPIPSLGNPAQLDPTLFTKAVGDVAGPFPATNGQVAFQIASRQPPKEEDFPAQQQQVEDRLLGQKREQAFAVFQESLRSRLEAAGDYVIYQDALTKMTTAAPTEHPPYPHTHPPGF